jgi:HK97 family phage portal protein
VFNKILEKFGYRKESRTWSALMTLGLDQPVWTPRDYERLAKVGYQQNADVYACVTLIARSAKQVPFFVLNKEGGTLVSNNHPLAKLLKKPNEFDTESDFKEQAISYLELSGNTYIERSGGSEDEAPTFLYAHRPDRFKVVKGNRRTVVGGYQYTNGSSPINFQPWEILHLKLFNPVDDWYGQSPMEAAAYSIDNSNEAQAMYKKLLQKGYPPGAIQIRGVDYTDIQIADMKRGLKLASEQNEILLLQDAEWKEIGFKPIDSAIFEARMQQKRDIAAVFGVPSGMIGDTQVKTYANSREERRSLYTEAVIPALTKLRDGLNTWLSPLFDGAWIEIDKDAIDALAEDRDVQATRVNTLYSGGIIKRGEARDELGYEALPEDEDGFINDINKPVQAQPVAAPDQMIPEPPPAKKHLLTAGTNGYYLKGFNLLSEEQKDNHWKAVEERRTLWYNRNSAKAEDRFLAEANVVVKAFSDNGETAAIRAVSRQEDEWMRVYKQMVFPVAEDFARQTLSGIKSDGYDPMEIKFNLDLFTQFLVKWLATEGATRVVGVLDTTKEQIRKELAAGALANESIFELSKRLTGMYKDMSMVRAERIARTETISASNMGSHLGAKSTNLPLKKTWIATLDKRTRSPHAHAHNQVVKMDAPFEVMGQKLMWPGDSSLGASAENTIQCRCTNAFSVDRGD